MAATTVAVVVCHLYRRGKMAMTKKFFDLTKLKPVIVDGKVCVEDIVAEFRLHNLDEQMDVPFVTLNANRVYGREIKAEFPLKKDGYETLLLGVYDRGSDSLGFAEVLYVRQMDEKLVRMFAGGDLIVLK